MDGGSSSGGLGKLLPKAMSAKHRRKKDGKADTDDDDSGRGRSPASSRNASIPDSASTRSLNMTDSDLNVAPRHESDQESTPAPPRPSVPSAHPSQVGYLTTSSPLVQAVHRPESQPAATTNDDIDPLDKSATLPVAASGTGPKPSTLRQSKTGFLDAERPSSSRRSPSPVGRLREVFKSKKAPSGSSSPERKPEPPEPAPSASPGLRQPVPGRPLSGPVPQLQPYVRDNPADKAASSDRPRPPKVDTSKPPRTPPAGDATAGPLIVNTPPTPTDPSHLKTHTPSPEKAQAAADATPTPTKSSPVAAQSSGMISGRRLRSGSGSIGPSKLSNITLAPLSPTPENGSAPSPSSGFFSSMITAAQNAASTFTTTIQNTNLGPVGNKNKSTTNSVKEREQSQTPDQVEVESSVEEPPQHPMEEKELAVRTLGLGDLSLSQLGIVETPTTGTVNSPAAKAAEPMEARHRSDSMPVEPHAPPSLLNGETAVDDLALSRPKSITNEAAEDKTPPPSLDHHETKSGLERSGSVRSAIGRRRKRGSSAATGGTGGTIAAAIVAANSSFANPAANPSLGRKFTGFAVANKKRNRDFHNLFKSVPDDDYLIEDYSCAVQREILAHGRLYVSEGHLCFSSNILGWTTTIVISYDEIVSIEKRSTALVFKNGLVISTLHAKHTFASFTSRDSTYDLIVKIWRLGHPSLRSTLNGVSIDEPGGDKTERIDIGAGEPQATQSASGSDEESEGEEDDEDEYIYDEDEDHDERAGAGQSTEAPPAETEADKAVIRKASGAVATNGTPVEPPKEAPAQPGGDDFPGPATHAPTDCGDAETHYDKIVGDDIIPAPLGKVYNLVFGPASVNWMAKFLVNDQKCTDLTMADKKGLSLENKSRTYSYVKPLNSSIGPKSTKCIVTETIEHLDLEKAVNITCATVTPDVPSGNIFSTKTKYCLSWAENNQTRVQMNCTVEWTGKSWLKAPIEKGANDGQVTYAKDLNAALRGAVTSRPRSRTASNGAAKAGASGPGAKKRRKGKSASGAVSGIDGSEHPRSPGDRRGGANAQNWGLLEPVRPFLGPVVDIVAPVLTGNVVYGLLVGLLVASWFGFGFRGGGGAGSGVVGPGGGVGVPRWPYGYLPTTPDQYEEMWRREESELWDWLEERVGLDRLGDLTRPGSAAADNKPQAVRGGSGSGGAASAPKGEALSSKTLEERMREDRMSEREVDEAIRVTEEKLRLLRAVVERRKAAASRGASRDSESAADDRGGGPSMAADGGQQQAVL